MKAIVDCNGRKAEIELTSKMTIKELLEQASLQIDVEVPTIDEPAFVLLVNIVLKAGKTSGIELDETMKIKIREHTDKMIAHNDSLAAKGELETIEM